KENEELREELKRLEGVEDYVLSIERANKRLRKLLSEERIEQILSTPNFDIIFVNDKLKKDLARAIAKGKDEK
ncbi:hypothetical protein LCGC14_1962290, partial [marine sediment metagenome]